jgi:hypothetical protein
MVIGNTVFINKKYVDKDVFKYLLVSIPLFFFFSHFIWVILPVQNF